MSLSCLIKYARNLKRRNKGGRKYFFFLFLFSMARGKRKLEGFPSMTILALKSLCLRPVGDLSLPVLRARRSGIGRLPLP